MPYQLMSGLLHQSWIGLAIQRSTKYDKKSRQLGVRRKV